MSIRFTKACVLSGRRKDGIIYGKKLLRLVKSKIKRNEARNFF